MEALLARGALTDLAVAVIALELLVLLVLRARGVLRAGLRPLDIVGQLLAGACLLFALRCALTGADPRWTLALMTLSFPAHVLDLVRRARPSRP